MRDESGVALDQLLVHVLQQRHKEVVDVPAAVGQLDWPFGLDEPHLAGVVGLQVYFQFAGVDLKVKR